MLFGVECTVFCGQDGGLWIMDEITLGGWVEFVTWIRVMEWIAQNYDARI